MNKPIKRGQSELVHFAEREVSRTEFNKPIKRGQSELVHFAEREVSRTEFNKLLTRDCPVS